MALIQETPARPTVEPCGQCPVNAQCCSRGIEVHVSQVKLIETLPLPIAKPWFTERPLDWQDNTELRLSTLLTKKGCIFLTQDMKCSIHSYCLENGLDVATFKPRDCIEYPYLRGKLNSDYKIFCGIYFGEPIPEHAKAYVAANPLPAPASAKT